MKVGDRLYITKRLYHVYSFFDDEYSEKIAMRTWSRHKQTWLYRVELVAVVEACLSDGTFRRAK